MKIDPAAPQRPATVRRTGAAGPARSGGFAKALAETADSGGISGTAPTGALGAMLAAQEVPDATEGRRRGRRRGEALLDHLEEIRVGLLLGAIPLGQLHQLRTLLQSARGTMGDPRLEELLDEIELRAAVELAKLTR
jgi:hypothetical protein